MEFPKEISEMYKRGIAGPALDLGTGSGENLKRIISVGRKRLVVGLDVDADAVKRVLKMGVETVQGVSECLPFRDESFALVASTYSFHHFNDRRVAAQEIRRVLKPLGFAFIIDWLPESPGLAYHTEEHLKQCMFETLSAFQDMFDRFHMTVREEVYMVFVEKEEM